MIIFIRILFILFIVFQVTWVQAWVISVATVATNINIYNQIAEQYNAIWNENTSLKRKVLLKLRTYVNKKLSFEEKLELKRRSLSLRTIPKNWIIPLLPTGNIINQVTSVNNITQETKSWSLIIKETIKWNISKDNNYVVYQSELTATGWDIILEKIYFSQFGTGNWVNIGKITQRDSWNGLFLLSNSRDTRIFNYKFNWDKSMMLFDIYTWNLEIPSDNNNGFIPWMRIKNGETVIFTIKLDIDTLSLLTHGEDFQRKNYFFAKYKIEGLPELINWYSRRVTWDGRVIENGKVVEFKEDSINGITINQWRRVKNWV